MFSAELNGCVSPPLSGFAKPASGVSENALISGEPLGLIATAIAAQSSLPVQLQVIACAPVPDLGKVLPKPLTSIEAVMSYLSTCEPPTVAFVLGLHTTKASTISVFDTAGVEVTLELVAPPPLALS